MYYTLSPGSPIQLQLPDESLVLEVFAATTKRNEEEHVVMPPEPPPSAVSLCDDTGEKVKNLLVTFARRIKEQNNWSSVEFVLATAHIECAVAHARNESPHEIVDALPAAKKAKYGEELISLLTQELSSSLHPPSRVLVPKGDIAKACLDEFHRTALIMTNPQECALRIIKAPAGGGKSTLLLNIAKQWPTLRFLFIAFSRDLCCEMKTRASDLVNIDVVTLDAFCKRRREIEGAPFLSRIASDSDIVRSEYPMLRGGRAKGSHGFSNVAVRAMQSAVRTADDIALCQKHEPMRRCLNASILRNSFVGCRHSEFMSAVKKENRLHVDFDVIMVDEVQDLSVQDIEIIRALAKPAIFVGDPLQAIFDFQNEGDVCKECLHGIENAAMKGVHNGSALLNHPSAVQLYGTFRLNASTVSHLERLQPQHFQAVSVGSSKDEDDAVKFIPMAAAAALPRVHLRLCRTNAEVIETLRNTQGIAYSVVSGCAIADEIQAADSRLPAKLSSRRRRYTAIERIVIREREQVEGVAALIQQLRDRHVDLEGAAKDVPSLSTVHRAKGYETEFVAIGRKLYDGFAKASADLCVSFVAMSRHKKMLFVLQEEGRGKKRQR